MTGRDVTSRHNIVDLVKSFKNDVVHSLLKLCTFYMNLGIGSGLWEPIHADNRRNVTVRNVLTWIYEWLQIPMT